MTGVFMKFLVLVLAALTATPAFAYLDPGTGSMILQVLLGGVAAASVALKLYWDRIKSFFVRTPKTETPTNDGDE